MRRCNTFWDIQRIYFINTHKFEMKIEILVARYGKQGYLSLSIFLCLWNSTNETFQ